MNTKHYLTGGNDTAMKLSVGNAQVTNRSTDISNDRGYCTDYPGLYIIGAKEFRTNSSVQHSDNQATLDHGDERATAWLKGKAHLSDAIAEAEEDGSDEPTEDAVVNTGKMFGMVEDLLQSHEIESVVTDDGDAMSYVTDARKNYVMFNCTASGKLGIHFNIRSHQIFDSPDSVPLDFVRTLIRSMKSEPATL